jgi:SAM-dependent methyltransferase
MKNRDKWLPSKYVYNKGKLVASRNRNDVGISSRLVTDIVAEFYHDNLRHLATGKLLDLGCGKVPLFMAYRDYVIDNICVDWANTLHKNEYLDFECDLTKPLPFEDGEFNTIILSDVLEHLQKPEFLLGEMSRVLAKHGKIIVNVPFYYGLHETPNDYYRYTQFALRDFVNNAGLKLIKLNSIGGVPEIMTDIFSKNVMRVPKIGSLIAMFAQWLTSIFIKTKIGRKISKATAEDFPLLYVVVAEKAD